MKKTVSQAATAGRCQRNVEELGSQQANTPADAQGKACIASWATDIGVRTQRSREGVHSTDQVAGVWPAMCLVQGRCSPPVQLLQIGHAGQSGMACKPSTAHHNR